jgi:hypothetical protein
MDVGLHDLNTGLMGPEGEPPGAKRFADKFEFKEGGLGGRWWGWGGGGEEQALHTLMTQPQKLG